MENNIERFCYYIEKAIELSEKSLRESDEELFFSIENRDRLMKIIHAYSEKINWETIDSNIKNDLFLKIELLNKLDLTIIENLEKMKTTIKDEIRKTVKNKECIQGYNLQDTK